LLVNGRNIAGFVMSQTLRTFIALELPTAVHHLLEKLQRELKSVRLRARWVRSENIHLTLKFLGNINPGDINQIGVVISEAAEKSAPLRLSVQGIGFFPGIKRPRVVWVGLGGQVQQLIELQLTLANKLEPFGFPKDKRPFKGHLTLGRIKEAVSPKTIRRIIQEYADFGTQEFTAGQIILYKSDLRPSGAVYTPLQRVDFGMPNDV
jgi:2'-5' RNA ligase